MSGECNAIEAIRLNVVLSTDKYLSMLHYKPTFGFSKIFLHSNLLLPPKQIELPLLQVDSSPLLPFDVINLVNDFLQVGRLLAELAIWQASKQASKRRR